MVSSELLLALAGGLTVSRHPNELSTCTYFRANACNAGTIRVTAALPRKTIGLIISRVYVTNSTRYYRCNVGMRLVSVMSELTTAVGTVVSA